MPQALMFGTTLAARVPHYWCIAVYFGILASKALRCTPYHAEHFSCSQLQPRMSVIWTRTDLVLLSIADVPRSGSGSSSDASQDATDSGVSSLTSVQSGIPSGVEEDSQSAADTQIVWAKSAREGLWGLPNVFANGKLYFTRYVSQANCLPQGLELPAKPAAKPAPKAAKPCAKSSAKSAAKPAARWQPSSQACSWRAHSCGPC